MRWLVGLIGVGLAAAALTVAAPGVGTPKAPVQADPAEDVNALKLEVDALEDLFALDLTREQLRRLLALAEGCGDKHRARNPARVSDGLRQNLRDLRDAFIVGDDERIVDLQDEWAELVEKLDPEFDDEYAVTAAARAAAPKAFAVLGIRQIIAFACDQGPELADPREAVEAGLADGKDLDDDEWAGHRDAVAEEVAELIAGPDARRQAEVKARVVGLLERLRDRKWKPAELDAEVQALANGATALDLLRNAAGCHLARLLSNPEAVTAIRARIAGKAKSGRGA
jgi:hypothetical protein